MVVEKEKGEIIIRFADNIDISEVENMIDYLKYKELVSKSEANFEEVDDLIELIKSDIGEAIIKRKVFN